MTRFRHLRRSSAPTQQCSFIDRSNVRSLKSRHRDDSGSIREQNRPRTRELVLHSRRVGRHAAHGAASPFAGREASPTVSLDLHSTGKDGGSEQQDLPQVKIAQVAPKHRNTCYPQVTCLLIVENARVKTTQLRKIYLTGSTIQLCFLKNGEIRIIYNIFIENSFYLSECSKFCHIIM